MNNVLVKVKKFFGINEDEDMMIDWYSKHFKDGVRLDSKSREFRIAKAMYDLYKTGLYDVDKKEKCLVMQIRDYKVEISNAHNGSDLVIYAYCKAKKFHNGSSIHETFNICYYTDTSIITKIALESMMKLPLKMADEAIADISKN